MLGAGSYSRQRFASEALHFGGRELQAAIAVAERTRGSPSPGKELWRRTLASTAGGSAYLSVYADGQVKQVAAADASDGLLETLKALRYHSVVRLAALTAGPVVRGALLPTLLAVLGATPGEDMAVGRQRQAVVRATSNGNNLDALQRSSGLAHRRLHAHLKPLNAHGAVSVASNAVAELTKHAQAPAPDLAVFRKRETVLLAGCKEAAGSAVIIQTAEASLPATCTTFTPSRPRMRAG